MRYLPLAILLVAVGCDGPKQGSPPSADPVGHLLRIGDPAPPFAATAWLHGTPVTPAVGKPYVVDFWATWCGPCLKSMPHLNELAKKHREIPFITVATADQYGNTREAVEKYIAETGHEFDLHFAFCDAATVYEAWVMAAGRDSIPCAVVVDAAGKIAFIGHPDDLDAVLPKVAAGTWQGKTDVEAMAAVELTFQSLLKQVEEAGNAAARRLDATADAQARLAAYDAGCRTTAAALLGEMIALMKAHPWKLNANETKARLIGFYLWAGQYDDAAKLTEIIIPWATETQNVAMLEETRLVWVKRRTNPNRVHIALAVQAAEAILKLHGENDSIVILNAAETYAAAGNIIKFDAMAAKARQLEKASPERLQKVVDALKSFR